MPNRKRDTDIQNRLLNSVGEGEGGMFWENSIETCILSRVKRITSSGWMHETSARTWCTGKTQRDWVEREVGGGIRMGNTCNSMADSCHCVAETTTVLWSDWPPTSGDKWKKKKKLNIQKTKIMAFNPIISWQIEGEKWKQWKNLFSWVPKSLWWQLQL